MEKIRLNLFQEKLWLDELLKAPTSEYNEINFTFRVKGNLSVPTLREAYRSIMMEYIPLSSTIQVRDNTPYFIHETDTFEVPFHTLKEYEIAEYGSVEAAIDALAKRPFDLEKEFPCRFFCLISGDVCYLFHLIHHVALDGNTAHSFFGRLSEIYNQLLAGGYNPVSQTDDINEYNTLLSNSFQERKQDNVKYWNEYLSDTPIYMSIPQCYHAGKNVANSYSFQFTIDRNLELSLSDLCKRHNSTLFRAYFSIWAFTLSKMLNTRELLVVHSLAMLPKDKRLFGTYINNLPIRFVYDEDDTFLDILSRADDNRKQEKEHAIIHYSDFIPHGQNGVVSKDFNIGINYPLSLNSMKLELKGCDVELWRHVPMMLPTDLMLSIETDGVVSGEIRYNTQLDISFIKSISETFIYILQQITESPEMLLKDIRLIPLAKQERLQAVEDKYLHSVSLPSTFLKLFKNVVSGNPGQTAIVFDGKSVTYSELDRLSDAVAHLLISRNIIHKRVGISIPKSIDTIVGILGILKSSNSYVPIDHTWPMSRIRHINDDCGITLFLTNQETASYLEGLSCLDIGKILDPDNISTESLPEVDFQDEAYIIYTSGTTGVSKGIPVNHRMLAHTIANNISMLHLSTATRIMQYINVVFDASVVEIFPSLAAGCTLFLPLDEERKDSNMLVSFLHKNNINLATLPAVMLSNLPHEELPSLATLIIGGDTTSLEAMKHWSKDRTLINVYGPSENTVDTTFNVVCDDSDINDIGTNMPGATCYVLDSNLRMLPDYAIGELFVGGVKLTEGYLNRKELNEKKFLANPFASETDLLSGTNNTIYRTGDLVMRRNNGHLLFIGRSDFQVKLNGYRIELGEIETCMKSFGHGINDAVVLVNDDNGTKRLVAYILTEDSSTFNDAALKSYMNVNLPSYMVPSVIVPLERFHYNSSGKVDRKKLPACTTTKVKDRYKIPFTVTEKRLAKIWGKLTGADFIGCDESFKSLGGDSISVLKLVYELHNTFGINLCAADIYKNATLSELAFFIDSATDDNDAVVERNLLSVACEVLDNHDLTVDSDLFAEGMSAESLVSFVNKAATKHNVFFTTYDVKATRCIAQLVSTIDRNLYFWSEGQYTGKPIILFINGFVDYYPYNEPVVTALEKHFSVFNIESFCNYFINKSEVSLEELLEVYEDIVTVALKDKTIFAVTGYCVGAELSIVFAEYMRNRHNGMNLQVINIEGIYDRTLYNELNLESDYFGNSLRPKIFNSLYENMPPLNYDGRVINIMVGQPMDLSPKGKDATDEKAFKEKVYRAWHDNIENWKLHYPNAPLYFVDCSHMYFREKKNLKSFMQILRQCWGNILN